MVAHTIMAQQNDSLADNKSRLGLDETIGVGFSFVCHDITQINSRGLWFGDDPLTFSFPLLLLQLSLISIVTRFLYVFLRPFGQPTIVSQILGGVILGPSILGHNLTFAEKVFPSRGRTVLETFSVFGFMLFIFLVGVKIDPSIVLKSSRQALSIGTLGFFLPLALASSVRLFLCHFLSLADNVCEVLQQVVNVQSMTTFPVIAIFLSELKILNSEIGRLACSSSMICDVCYWSIISLNYLINIATAKSLKTSIGSLLSVGLLVGVIVFGIRRAALWVIRNTPEGKPVKEIYIFMVLVTLMGCGLFGEVIGIHALASAFVLGLVIPDGPPLGAALVERLDCFVSVLLMPIFFTLCGLKTNVFSIRKWKTVGIIEMVLFVGFLGKTVGTMLPPLFCRMPLRDALSLGLIMNSKGIIELILLNNWRAKNVLNDECFAIMIISVVVVTGVISPLVKALYDPSRRFLAYRRRTIEHHRRSEELRILACIYSHENVQTVMALLNASMPVGVNQMSLYVLHLIKLAGRASSLLIAHRPREKPSENPSQSERIFNAFGNFGEENRMHLSVHCYKGISPYATMHNDVCSLALEQRITLIIIPFHKQVIWNKTADSSPIYRHLNKNVLDKAPCSVGVLIDRGHLRKSKQVISEPSFYRVAVLFFGGADDREALAFSMLMVENPHVLVTLLHFTSSMSTGGGEDIAGGSAISKMLDSEILDSYKLHAQSNDQFSYQEERVTDDKSVVKAIESMGDSYDLVMVGKRHGESQLMDDLKKWNEHEELGVVGELIAAKDFKLKASVLVVQQQIRVWGMRDPEMAIHLKNVKV